MEPSIQQLVQHVQDLAKAFDVELIFIPELKRHEAACIAHPVNKNRFAILSRPIDDETGYAVVMHELGHRQSPCGMLRMLLNVETDPRRDPRAARLMLDEEYTAWEWAEHYALYWSTAMEMVKRLCLTNYESNPALRKVA